jgi:hypothetical protein
MTTVLLAAILIVLLMILSIMVFGVFALEIWKFIGQLAATAVGIWFLVGIWQYASTHQKQIDPRQLATWQAEYNRGVAAAEARYKESSRQPSNGSDAAVPPAKAAIEGELNKLRSKLISLWNPPEAVSKHPELYVVTIRIRLTRDHRLVEVLTNGDGPLFEAARDSAMRAVYQAQPYDMLSPTTYDRWKEIDVNFDPREVATPQDAG